jgi:hypothetical protein
LPFSFLACITCPLICVVDYYVHCGMLIMNVLKCYL